MNRAIAFAVLVCSAALAAQTPQPRTKPTPQPRYLLVPAEVKAGIGFAGGELTHEVFLIDTETGRVWRFQPGGVINSSDGNSDQQNDMFIPVTVLVTGDGLAKAAQETKH